VDYFSSFQISATGLMAEKLRLEAVALNLANANATYAPGVAPYRAVRVVSRPIGAADFQQHLQGAQQTFSAQQLSGSQRQPAGVATLGLATTDSAPRMVFDPKHPDADSNGFVAHANVDSLAEMTSMMSALRAYEANIKALAAAKTMAQKALEIGSSK
jgi:flagellar basal-body rod protein FlgC